MNAGNSTTCRIRLAKELRELRARARVSAEEAAAELNCSPAKISRLENAKGKVMPRDVRDLLSLYRVGPGPQRDALMEMARKAGEATWWTAYESVLPARLETYVAYETDAARL
jgi:transcriptional regulator with XRE-family HTH domain